MSVPVLTFFNNKSGVGKTTLVYHLAWMYSLLGKCVIAVDLDPQANLTAAFLEEDEIEDIWESEKPGSTIFQCVRPLADVSDIVNPQLKQIDRNLYLVPGDAALSGYEDILSSEWPDSMGNANLYRPMRVLSSFWQVMQMGAASVGADILLVDIGPNLGAINRSVLIGTDYVVIPLGADLFSLQGLKNLGPALRGWKNQWKKRLDNWSDSNDARTWKDFLLPEGRMEPLGYLCQQHGVRLERPIKAYDKWINRIPDVYRQYVLNDRLPSEHILQANDPYCLGTIRHYRSLVPMAQEKRKPVFNLTSADGAIGSHAHAVQDVRKDFRQLARKIAKGMGMEIALNKRS